MGFSGGGSNVLLPHTHDGTVSQDGGPLDFNNVTQSQSSAGQVFYSDGVHLQQLAYPGVPAGETLTAAALSTAPSWAAAAPAATVWTELSDTVIAGAPANLVSSTFSHYDILQVHCWRANTPGNSYAFTFNSTGGAGQYSSHFFTNYTTDEDYATTDAALCGSFANTDEPVYTIMNIMNLDGEEKCISQQSVGILGPGNTNLSTTAGFMKTTFTTDITSIQCTTDAGATLNQKVGGRMIVLGSN